MHSSQLLHLLLHPELHVVKNLAVILQAEAVKPFHLLHWNADIPVKCNLRNI